MNRRLEHKHIPLESVIVMGLVDASSRLLTAIEVDSEPSDAGPMKVASPEMSMNRLVIVASAEMGSGLITLP